MIIKLCPIKDEQTGELDTSRMLAKSKNGDYERIVTMDEKTWNDVIKRGIATYNAVVKKGVLHITGPVLAKF